jgi:hypothetical protein
LIVAASYVAAVSLAAAVTASKHGPLALLGSTFDDTQVVGFVPHQHFSGSPWLTQALAVLTKQP